MPVYYDSSKIIPAPFFSLKETIGTMADGTPIAAGYDISLIGKIVAEKGSPNSAGTFWQLSDYPPDEVLTHDEHLKSLLMKESALRKLFSNHGKSLEIQPWDGSAPTKCNPRIKGIEFSAGQSFNTVDYSISMEADQMFLNGVEISGDASTYKVLAATNEWTLETLDEKLKTYRLTHNVSATGKLFYDETGALTLQAWEQAKLFVLNRLTLGLNPLRMSAPDVLNAEALQAFNYLRTQQINESSGVFSVTETWVCFDPQSGAPATDEFQISVRTAFDQRQTVSAEGTITGYEQRDNSTWALLTTRYANASTKWGVVEPLLFSRIQTASGITLNPTVIQKTVSKNEIAGTINYSLEYDNRAAPTTVGAVSEIITVSNSGATDKYAEFDIPGRGNLGSLIQDMNAKSSKKTVVNIEIQMPAKTYGGTITKPNTDSLALSLRPSGSYLDDDTNTWVETNGRYTRSLTFTWN